MALLTIPDENAYAVFDVTTSDSSFPITFSLPSGKADLRVSVDGTELDAANFTFTGTLLDGGGYDGGTVDLSTAAVNERVIIWRDVTPYRTSNFSPATSIPVRSIDFALNRLQAQLQDAKQAVARTLQVPPGETLGQLPNAATRAGNALIFDGNGDATVGGVVDLGAAVAGAAGLDVLASSTATAIRDYLAVGFYFNVMDPAYGAVGDGVTDDATAIQAAINAAGAVGGVVAFPAGKTFLVGTALTCAFDNVGFQGFGYSNVEWDTSVTNTGHMLYITGDNCWIDNLIFRGDVYTAFGDTINPGSLVRCNSPSFATVQKFRASRVTLIGGTVGLAIWDTDDVTLDDVYVYKTYGNGAFTSAGGKRIRVDGFRAIECGIGEGFKFGANTTGTAYDTYIFTNFMILNCGKLDTTAANHQEGLDMFVADAKYVSVSNGWIIGCGNGGVELKTQAYAGLGYDNLEQITFNNVHVVIKDIDDLNQPGFTATWNDGGSGVASSGPPNANKNRRIRYINCTVTVEGTSSSGDYGQAWNFGAIQDAEMIDCHARGTDSLLRISGQGGVDATARRITLRDCVGRVVGNGIYHANGGLEGLTIDGCDVESTGGLPLVLTTGTNATATTDIVLKNSRFVNLGTTSNDNAAQFSAIANMTVDTCYFEAESRAVSFGDSTPNNVAATFRTSTFYCRDSTDKAYAVAANEGTYTLEDCYFDLPGADSRSWVNQGSATFKVVNAFRGSLSTAPVAQGGAVGDVYRIYNAAAGGYQGYICTAAADNNATWKGINAIEA